MAERRRRVVLLKKKFRKLLIGLGLVDRAEEEIEELQRGGRRR